MRAAILTTLALLITGCPSDRTAQKTLYGSTVDLPPALHAPAPPAIAIITGLRAPESVLHDPEQDVYFISNINGGMLTADGNGFLSRVDANTLAVQLKWVESGKNGARLDAPKGMAILGDTRYVSDIHTVRKFDRRTGAPSGEIAISGTTFLNDIATDGRSLYVSDTGVRLGPGTTFIATGTDAIWKITGDRAEKIAGGTDLGRPNGLDYFSGALHVVTFGSNELYALHGGKKKEIARLPTGQLDGLVHLADGTPVVTSWEGDEIYRGRHAILAGLDAPADVGYDARRHRLLVPHPPSNHVTLHVVQ
jgi:hypothetical protein